MLRVPCWPSIVECFSVFKPVFCFIVTHTTCLLYMLWHKLSIILYVFIAYMRKMEAVTCLLWIMHTFISVSLAHRRFSFFQPSDHHHHWHTPGLLAVLAIYLILFFYRRLAAGKLGFGDEFRMLQQTERNWFLSSKCEYI